MIRNTFLDERKISGMGKGKAFSAAIPGDPRCLVEDTMVARKNG